MLKSLLMYADLHSIQEFERMDLTGYHLNKEGEYYYLSLDRARVAPSLRQRLALFALSRRDSYQDVHEKEAAHRKQERPLRGKPEARRELMPERSSEPAQDGDDTAAKDISFVVIADDEQQVGKIVN